MKKLITTIFTLLFFAISFSQISYGVKAGYSNSSMKWNEGNIKTKFDSKSYFYFGGFVENKISEKVTLQGELHYTELGGKYERDLVAIVGDEIVNMGKADFKIKVPQISLPISAKYSINEQIKILGGINFNFIVNPTFETVPDITIPYKKGDIDSFKSFNVNPFIGAEYQFYKNFFAEARYNIGLLDAAKADAINTYFNTFQIGFGYKF